jgi:hypothetical protein
VPHQKLSWKVLLKSRRVRYIELEKLAANHTNVTVRLYALQALKGRQRIKNVDDSLMGKFRRDSTEVFKVTGCFENKKAIKTAFRYNCQK